MHVLRSGKKFVHGRVGSPPLPIFQCVRRHRYVVNMLDHQGHALPPKMKEIGPLAEGGDGRRQ